MLQIRKGNRDNLGTVFFIFPLKHILYPSLLHLTKMVLMSGHNICSHREIRTNRWKTGSLHKADMTKNIFEIF